MKLTPQRIMAAYKAIHELSNCVFPYRVTRNVHKLKKRISEEFEVVLEHEQALVTEMGGTLQDAQYHFDSVEQAELFNRAYTDFLHQEDEVSLPKVDVSSCLDSVRISSGAIDALQGIVDFGEE